MDGMAEPSGMRGYLSGQNDGPGGESMPDPMPGSILEAQANLRDALVDLREALRRAAMSLIGR